MLVRRKRSNKRKRKFYEAFEFSYPYGTEFSTDKLSAFLGKLGEIKYRQGDYINFMWVEMKDGRTITAPQFLLKDDRQGRILSFDLITFYKWYDIWNT